MPEPLQRKANQGKEPSLWRGSRRRLSSKLMNSRILLIEDEPGLVLTLSDLLEAEGHAVESAPDGPTGLAKATTEPFAAVILDEMLPGENGFDVCGALRPDGSDGAVLMCAARRPGVDC